MSTSRLSEPARLRIAMISEHASPLASLGGVDAGGQNVHVGSLAAALARRGHLVQVYTRRDGPGMPKVVTTPEGIEVVHVPAGPARPIPKDELLPFMREFGEWLARRWLEAEQPPDIVHSHFWMSGVAALRAGAGAPGALPDTFPPGLSVAVSVGEPLPLVATLHALGTVKKRMQGPADTSPQERAELESLVVRTADRIIAQCSDEVRELLRIEVPRERISVIPSGVDVERFSPGPLGPRLRSASRPARILCVGRMVARKGFLDMVKALRRIPGAQLIIAGGPPRRELDGDPVARGLRESAKELGVADRVQMLGAVPREEMPDLYRSVDLLACTPAYEPFGLTPLEAMACGTPVVAYAVGGLMDSVAHGVSGLLVSPGDVNGLAKAIRELLSCEPRRYAYAVAGMSQARARYPWSRVAEQVEAVYRSVISRNLLGSACNALVAD
jgi:glycosyltransferase involved in cell wall biosynthesis